MRIGLARLATTHDVVSCADGYFTGNTTHGATLAFNFYINNRCFTPKLLTPNYYSARGEAAQDLINSS